MSESGAVSRPTLSLLLLATLLIGFADTEPEVRAQTGARNAATSEDGTAIRRHRRARRPRRRRPGWPWEPGAPRPTIGAQAGDEALRGLVLQQSANAPADRVVIISMDGMRPDAIGRVGTPNLDALIATGARAEVAETIRRSSTLPSHASMLSGVTEEVHRMNFNGYRPGRGRIQFPSIFRVARAAGVPTRMFTGKQKLAHIIRSEDVDHFVVGGVRCSRVNRVALPNLVDFDRGLAFVHFPDTDGAGHTHGWLSPQYYQAVRRIDGCVGDLMEVLSAAGSMERTLIIVTSDHGGHGHTHGAPVRSDMRIPWFAAGGVARAGVVLDEVHTTDTAATALAALGLPQPLGMHGRVQQAALR